MFVLVSSFYIFFWLRVLDKAEYSAFESTLKIVSYVSLRNYSLTQPLVSSLSYSCSAPYFH